MNSPAIILSVMACCGVASAATILIDSQQGLFTSFAGVETVAIAPHSAWEPNHPTNPGDASDSAAVWISFADTGFGGTYFQPSEHPAELDVENLHPDLVHYEATFGGRPLELTPREFDFLAYLARHVGKVCTRRMILENVWGPGYEKELHYLKVYAYRIRRKLGDENGQLLQSDPAVGYRLTAPDN